MIRNKQNKTIVNLSVAIVLLLMFTITMTFAYFTANRGATSGTMTFGTLEVEINNYAASSANCHAPMVPGCTIALAGSITTGDDTNIDAFLRLKPTITVEQVGTGDLAQESAIISALKPALISAFESQGNWLRPIVNSEPSGDYLYYKTKFAPNASAISLSGINIVIPTTFGNAWQDVAFKINMVVEAIQADHTGVTLTGTAQTDVNAIATTASAMAAWDAIGSAQGGNNQVETISQLAQDSVQYLSFYDENGNEIVANASDYSALGMNTLNSISASMGSLMTDNQTVIDVSVGLNTYSPPAEMEIPRYVKINGDAFEACLSTETGTIYRITSICDYGFDEVSITSIIIPDTVTSIGYGAFDKTCDLTIVNIPNSVTTIGDGAFGDTGLISIIIPSSVTSLGIGLFSGCYDLTSITVESGNIVYDSRNNCNAIIETSTNTLLFGCENTIIPNTITSIADNAFWYCSAPNNLIIPNSVTTIGDTAFQGSGLSGSVVIGSGVTSIGSMAFFCGQIVVYYVGTLSAWSNISIGWDEDGVLDSSKVYYYSETEPQESGRYWHYVNNTPTIWQ